MVIRATIIRGKSFDVPSVSTTREVPLRILIPALSLRFVKTEWTSQQWRFEPVKESN